MTARPQGPAERFAAVAVWSRIGTMWRVLDRTNRQYVPTEPRAFYSRENAAYTARAIARAATRATEVTT